MNKNKIHLEADTLSMFAEMKKKEKELLKN